jgi:hypothetical protein
MSSEKTTASELSKRGLDLVICVAALPILILFTFFVAVWMKLVSPGPIFFLQERVGFKGRRFKIYKFRTMAVAADTSVHNQYFTNLIGTNAPMVKLDAKGDSRLIAGGWLLRASGLDELPQLINVLRGEMSFVGPRPCICGEYESYTEDQKRRFLAKPGLTGLWQVSGKNRTTFSEMIRLDIKYAETRTIFLDLYIVAMTLPALVQQILDTRRSRKQFVLERKVVNLAKPVDAR